MQRSNLPKLSPPEPRQIYNFKMHLSWGVKDPERFTALMDEAASLVHGGSFLADNLFTWMRNNSAFDDAAFRQAWKSNITSNADEAVVWRRYILCCAAYHCIHLEGDFVECGVLAGTGVKTVIDFFGKGNFAKQFWAYDTFDTNPVDGHAFEVQSPGLFEKVKARFAGYGQVKLVKGLLPASLDGNEPEKVALMHIDLNKAEFEIAVLDRLFDKVVAGGIVVLDDYEWSGVYRDQKIKEDAWFEARSYRVFPLPTGQGLVIKR